MSESCENVEPEDEEIVAELPEGSQKGKRPLEAFLLPFVLAEVATTKYHTR